MPVINSNVGNVPFILKSFTFNVSRWHGAQVEGIWHKTSHFFKISFSLTTRAGNPSYVPEWEYYSAWTFPYFNSIRNPLFGSRNSIFQFPIQPLLFDIPHSKFYSKCFSVLIQKAFRIPEIGVFRTLVSCDVWAQVNMSCISSWRTSAGV